MFRCNVNASISIRRVSTDTKSTRNLRQHLVFSNHNVIQDAPFTQIHLVSCRNVLIYFRAAAQHSTLASFHFSLLPEGILFLGASESLGDLSDEFKTVDHKWRIYRKLPGGRDFAPRIGQLDERRLSSGVTRQPPGADRPPGWNSHSLVDVYDAFIKTSCVLGLLLDDKQNVVHVIGDVTQVLKSVTGRFRGTIGDFLDSPARTTISAAMIRAQREMGTSFVIEEVQPDVARPTVFNVSVMALTGRDDFCVGWIVQFDPVEKAPTKTVRVQHEPDDAYELLETELHFTKESLNASVEELEVSNEELQATNEELVASNEELQSTNEELHSVNEELHSVNAELHRKVDQLEQMTSDFEAFLNSSNVGTIVLSSDLRIRRFTKAITQYFNLMKKDEGRLITDFANRLGLENLEELLRDCIETSSTHTVQSVDSAGEQALVRIVPNLRAQRVIGAVITVMAQAGSWKSRSLFSYGEVGTWDWPDIHKDTMWWSPTCYDLLGLNRESAASFSRWKTLIHPSDVEQLDQVGTRYCPFVEYGKLHMRMLCADDKYRSFEFRSMCSFASDGELRSMAGTVCSSNVVSSHGPVSAPRHKAGAMEAENWQELARTAAQELQVPVQHLLDATNQLQQEFADPEKGSSVSTLLVENTEYLLHTLRGLTEYAQRNTQAHRFVNCDTDQLLADVLEDYADPIAATGMKVVHEPLPSLNADPTEVKTLFGHLIDNVLKHAQVPNPIIHIGAEQLRRETIIVFRDNGVGIPAELLEDVFEASRCLKLASSGQACGLGLALCRRIAETHGGWIWAENGPDQGTTIKLRMPLVQEHPSTNVG